MVSNQYLVFGTWHLVLGADALFSIFAVPAFCRFWVTDSIADCLYPRTAD
jgi:hypothetical protein